MTFFKSKINKIIGLFSILAVVLGLIAGIILRENKNNSKADSSKLSNFDYQNKISDNTQIEKGKTQKICREFLEEDQNSLVYKQLTNAKVVECTVVGCGALF